MLGEGSRGATLEMTLAKIMHKAGVCSDLCQILLSIFIELGTNSQYLFYGLHLVACIDVKCILIDIFQKILK